MKKYLEILKRCPLFHTIAEPDLLAMLSCLGATVHPYEKNEPILTEGDAASRLGILLSGTAQIIRIDFYGNRSIVAALSPSELFGEAFACAELPAVPVHVQAESACTVLWLDIQRILRPCKTACSFHNQMIFHLMKVLAAKNILLNQKIEILSKRTTREKLMTYLLMVAKQQGSNQITIPYDRQALADFLGVDRSGLSTEISKLRKEKKLDCRKNIFQLHAE